MGQYVSIEDIYAAYKDCRRNKRNSEGAMRYELDYEGNNYRLWKELNNMTYKPTTSVTFCVTRPKIREVFAANFRDRVVHHLIIRRWLESIEAEMIDASYNCRKGKGTLYGVRDIAEKIRRVSEEWTKETYVLKFDIQGFFMSIDKEKMCAQIGRIIDRDYDGRREEEQRQWWQWLTRTVAMHRPEQNCEKRGDITLWNKLPRNKSLFHTNGKGMAIGNLTSQVFANLYLSDFDKWMIVRTGGNYGRLTDDCVASGTDKAALLRLLEEARAYLRDELGLTLHPNKVYLQEARKGLPFVGYVIKPHRIYTQNRTVGYMAAMIEEWNRDKRPDTKRYVCRYNSYMGFLRHSASYAIRWQMWNKIRNKEGIYSINHKYIRQNDFHKSKKRKLPRGRRARRRQVRGACLPHYAK